MRKPGPSVDGIRRTVPTLAGIVALAGVLAGLGCAGKTVRVDVDSEDDSLIGVIGSKDFRSVCYEMAQSLIRLPQIQNSANPPTIAFTRVVNNSDELFSSDDFLYKMRTELIKHTRGKMLFLDRDVIEEILAERQAKARGQVTRSGDKPLYGANYFLAGRVESIRQTRGRRAATYVRLSFRLTDAASSAIVWEDDYEVKKYCPAAYRRPRTPSQEGQPAAQVPASDVRSERPSAAVDGAWTPPENWPKYTGELSGSNEIRIDNPHDSAVLVGVRSGGRGKDFILAPRSVGSVWVPPGNYQLFLNYPSEPDAVYQGDDFTLAHNAGVLIQLVKQVGGNYDIRRLR